MQFMYWGIFGLLAGVFSYLVDPEPQEGGFMGAVILGTLGAVVGGLLSDLFFANSGTALSNSNIISLAISAMGALTLLFVGRFFREA
jgi:uncharacterized membrane protein YeaQ/YmgE (transglycosylase-associated protein family)